MPGRASTTPTISTTSVRSVVAPGRTGCMSSSTFTRMCGRACLAVTARLHATGAVHVMQRAYDNASSERHQAAYPAMSWASNYRPPANGILWTLFWAGRIFTPDFSVHGRNVQDFLQGHLLGAMDAVAQRLKSLDHVIGFDSLNEPGTGWLGMPLVSAPLPVGQRVPMPALPGLVWSPLQALAAARGLPTALPLVGPSPDGGLIVQGLQTVNPDGVSIWRDGMV